ncbi:hypothetical protein VaNZ11_009760 [Volvox africanus]|uniref:Uncharacterized protein n=1 Tax=Volvox africanus TaxID=51714 RepID=A0ABQ5S9E8_9CHLO|nr:hypothetical protein VaNZ11_009760 [Volvox africanus]
MNFSIPRIYYIYGSKSACVAGDPMLQGVNALVYTAFASGLLLMPPDMKFHWNHSHVLQRGVVRPVRRPVRFRTHMRMLILEVVAVTPAFLAFSSPRRVATTTLVTYSLSAAVGMCLSIAIDRQWLA